MKRTSVLEREMDVAVPVERAFSFFADAFNLELLTPKTLRFRILTPAPIIIRAGTLIDYRLSLWGVPFRWQTLIEVFEPNLRFIDVQVHGPYALWRHEHRFEPTATGGTRLYDRVEYRAGFGPLGGVAQRLFVDREVERIFDYRQKVIAARFAQRPAATG